MSLALRISDSPQRIISFHRNETGPAFSQLVLAASQRVVALAHPHDTSRRWVTTIDSADTGYRAKTLSNPGKHRAWQRYATYIRSLDGIAKEGWVWGENHILGRQSS
jgi:hypothetical protein